MIMTDVSAPSGIDWSILWTKFGWLDGIFLFLFAVGIVFGLKKGLTKVCSGLLAVLAGHTAAAEYYKPLSHLAEQAAPVSIEILEPAFFAVLGFGSVILVVLILKLLSHVATLDFKGGFNTVGGAFAGAFQFVLFLGLLSSFLNLLPVSFFQQAVDHSIVGSYLVHSSGQVHQFTILLIPEQWRMK